MDAKEGPGTGFLPSASRSSGGLLLSAEENPSAPARPKKDAHTPVSQTCPAEAGSGWMDERKTGGCPAEASSGKTLPQ